MEYVPSLPDSLDNNVFYTVGAAILFIGVTYFLFYTDTGSELTKNIKSLFYTQDIDGDGGDGAVHYADGYKPFDPKDRPIGPITRRDHVLNQGLSTTDAPKLHINVSQGPELGIQISQTPSTAGPTAPHLEAQSIPSSDSRISINEGRQAPNIIITDTSNQSTPKASYTPLLELDARAESNYRYDGPMPSTAN
jgi:hypothetical protein